MNKKIVTQAICTNGLWYAYVDIDGKAVYHGKVGYTDRNDAVADGKAFLEANADVLTGE